MRRLSDGLKKAQEARHVRMIVLTELQFEAAPVRLHNSIGDIRWNDKLWQGVGALGRITEVIEDGVLRPGEFRMELNGLQPEWLVNARAERVRGRTAIIWDAARDLVTGELLGDPYLRTRGRMDLMQGVLGTGDATVALSIEDDRALLERTPNVWWSNEGQQGRHPGDLSCSVMKEVQGQRLDFGPGGGRTSGQNTRPDIDWRGPWR